MVLLEERRARVYLSGEEKARLQEQHDHRCAQCGAQWADFEWDHVSRLSQSLGPQTFQPLCVSCHRKKTQAEPSAFESDALASHFERGAWDSYVESPRVPPLVWKHWGARGEEGLQIADAIRCRKRALEFSAHELPVFCPLDDVQEVRDCVFGDLNLVTRRATDFVKQLGYAGPGWKNRVQTEWLLHFGVIAWSDVTHKLTATGRYPPDALRGPLQRMERAWGEAGLGKRSVTP